MKKGADVIAIDKSSELIDKIKDRVTSALEMDATDERSLRSANISDVDMAVVAIGDKPKS
jgi:trk system potassium uptake protein TrkA